MDGAGRAGPPRWLVTGASGRVGRMLWRYWRHAPPAADLVRQSRRGGEDDGDLLWDPLTVGLPPDAGAFDAVIAYAGVTPGQDVDTGVNAALAKATLSAAHDAGIGRVLLTSSSAVYGAPLGDAALTEDTPPRPVNDYGRSKLEMEAVCEPWRARGLEICCLRIGNVVGADALLLNGCAARGDPLILDRFADGEGPWRSYIGPATLARVTAALAAHPGPLPPCLNIGAPRPTAMADLARAAGFDWRWRAAPDTALQQVTLDVKRLAALYSFTPADSDPQVMIDQWIELRDPQ